MIDINKVTFILILILALNDKVSVNKICDKNNSPEKILFFFFYV